MKFKQWLQLKESVGGGIGGTIGAIGGGISGGIPGAAVGGIIGSALGHAAKEASALFSSFVLRNHLPLIVNDLEKANSAMYHLIITLKVALEKDPNQFHGVEKKLIEIHRYLQALEKAAKNKK